MVEQLNDQEEIIAMYAGGPNQLETAITGLSEGDLDIAQSEGAWTIRQIVHHVADGDDIWKIFIKRTIGNPGGLFDLDWYRSIPQDEWVKRWSYAHREIGHHWPCCAPIEIILCNYWNMYQKPGIEACLSDGQMGRNRMFR